MSSANGALWASRRVSLPEGFGRGVGALFSGPPPSRGRLARAGYRLLRLNGRLAKYFSVVPFVSLNLPISHGPRNQPVLTDS